MQYSLDSLKKAVRNPRSVVGELYRFGERVNQRLVSRDGFDPVAEDWDLLLILDACRADAYESVVGSSVDTRISPGTNSWSYYESAFDGRDLNNTVLVTANPHANDISANTFHAIKNVWSSDWDGTRETVLPETMANLVIDAAEMYPNKRIVGHWMQPHTPHLGEKAETLTRKHLGCDPTDSHEYGWIWNALRYGELARDEAWEAYIQTLERAYASVQRVAENTNGKVVVSADHGELFGERERPVPVRGYGHPPNVRATDLEMVPWHVISDENRRTVTPDPPEKEADPESAVEDRLEALGYA